MFCKILIFPFVFCFCACSYEPKQLSYVHEMVDVNYLVYMAADNNLERFGIRNIKALQEVGSSANANILVLFDRSPDYDRSEGNRSSTDLFLITKNPEKMNDDIIKSYGELDMTDPDTLYDFLITANTYFPSKHTILNIWSHGRGVYPDGIVSKAVIEDYTTGYGVKNMMSICDLSSAVLDFEKQTGNSIDIIQFDACDMQMIEVLYQLKNATDYRALRKTSCLL